MFTRSSLPFGIAGDFGATIPLKFGLMRQPVELEKPHTFPMCTIHFLPRKTPTLRWRSGQGASRALQHAGCFGGCRPHGRDLRWAGPRGEGEEDLPVRRGGAWNTLRVAKTPEMALGVIQCF